MALAPRSSLALRSLVLLMSHRKPHRSSFFSSSAAHAAVPPAAPGTGTPAAPAVQPPADPVPLSGSSHHRSVAPEERVIHPFPCSTPKIPIHKPSRPTLQDPKHIKLEPLTEKPSTCTAPENLTRLLPEDSCSTLQPPTDKPLAKKHPTHKGSHDPGHGVALGSRSSSHDQPRNRIHKPVDDKPLAHTLKDPEHPNQDGSCSTLPPVTYKPSKKTHPNHKVCEDPDLRVANCKPGLRKNRKEDPPRPIPGTEDR